VVGVGYGAPAFEALKNGSVDAEVTFTGGLARQIIAGYPARALPMSEAEKGRYSYNLFAAQHYIDANPDVIAGIGRATAKATVFLMTNPAAAVHVFWKQYPDRAPKDPNDPKAFANDLAVVKAQIQDMAADENPPDFKWGSQTSDVFQAIQQFYVDAGQIKTPIDPTMFYTSKFEAEYVKFDPNQIVAAAKAYK
jgi:NitT/TauT family transport system substrate-binding protein